MNIYCVKCKEKTDTVNEDQVTTKNGRNMIKGECTKCGGKKSQFVKGSTGGMYVISEKPKAYMTPTLDDIKAMSPSERKQR